jgi:hypothetical protein
MLRAPAHIVTKAVKAMMADSLVAEVPAAPDALIWGEAEDGSRTALIIAPAGLAAIGIEGGVTTVDTSPDRKRASGKRRGRGSKPVTAATRRDTDGTDGTQSKQDAVIALLRRQQGASIAEMAAATGWQTHSVRGFMSGALKKRLGMEVISEKDATGERRYYVAPIKAAQH